MNPPSTQLRTFSWGPVRIAGRSGTWQVDVRDGVIRAIRAVERPSAAAEHLVIPAFADAHVHLGLWANFLGAAQLRGCRSTDEVIARVRAVAARTEAGRWIIGRGYDLNLFAKDDAPHARRLDEATKDHPVYLASHDEHACWLNSRALTLAHVDRATTAPAGGIIAKDDRGEPTGLLFENAVQLVQRVLPKRTFEQWKDDLSLAQDDFLRRGIVVAQDMDPDTEEGWRGLEEEGRLRMFVATAIPARDLHRAIHAARRSGEGSERLKLGGVKFFLDGALGSRTAAMLECYCDRPQSRGTMLYDRKRIQEELTLCREHGLRPMVHAIGDAAVRMLIDTLLAIGPFPASIRPRVEHAQTIADEDLDRLAQTGAVASMQPVHLHSDVEIAHAGLGPRAHRSFRCASLHRRGVPIVLGTDAPVEEPDPFLNLHITVNRSRPDHPGEAPFFAEEALPFDVALAATTTDAAKELGFPDALPGIIEGACAHLLLTEHVASAPLRLIDRSW